MACVSAADNQTDIVTIDDGIQTDELQADENVGTFKELQEEINNFPTNEYKLEKNYTFSDSDASEGLNVIEIDRNNFVIDGQGYTLNGDGKSKIFSLVGSNIILKNINFINSYGDRSAVRVLNGGTIENCNFTNCVGADSIFMVSGGALEFQAGGTVRNSNFVNNSADNGGAIRAINNPITIEGCNFTNNHADNGGAFYSDTMVSHKIINCNFIGNRATGDGGAIDIAQYVTLNVAGCTFMNNTASGRGGAINMANSPSGNYGEINVKDSDFVNNTAGSNGGAIYLPNSGAIAGSVFIDNKATINSGGKGGAIYTANTATVTDSNFTNNSASSYGGAIYAQKAFTLDGSTFTSNAGDLYAVYGQNGGNVNNCAFIRNKQAALGFENGKVIVNNSNFVENRAEIGAGIYLVGNGEKFVINSNFTRNSGLSSPAIYFENNGTVDGCNFIENQADQGIGAIGFYGYGIVNNSNFINNKAQTTGAVQFEKEGIVNNSNFENNFALRDGGAIVAQEKLIIENTYFTNNTVRVSNGGAVYLTVGGTLNNCTLTDNSARGNGGAVYSKGNLSVNRSNFKNNNASLGGGAIYSEGQLTADLSEFIFNKASNQGGALYLNSESNAITNSVFENNKAEGIALELIQPDESIPAFELTFKGSEKWINAIWATQFASNNNTYWNGAMVNTDDVTPVIDTYPGIDIVVEVYDSSNNLVENVTLVTNGENKVVYSPLNLGDGNYTLRAYHPDDNYYSYVESSEFNFNLTRNSSQVKINIEDNANFTYGNCNIGFEVINRTVVRVVITDETGEVVYNQTAEDDYVIVDLKGGNYNITVYNEGDLFISPSSDSKLFTILKFNSTIKINPFEDIVYGFKIDVSLSVENLTAVNVTVYDDKDNNIVFSDIIYGDTFTIPVLAAGKYNLTVINMGNDTIFESRDSTKFYVFKNVNDAKVSVDDVVYGNETVIVVTAKVDGIYTVDVNGTAVLVDVTNGVGNASIMLGAGSYYANVTFNDNYTTDAINDTFEVFKASSTAMVSVDDVVYGNKSVIVVTATVDGIYTVDVNGTAVLVNVTGGTGNVSMIFGAGSYYANVTFNDNYTTDATNDTFVVSKAFNNIVVTVDDVVYGNESVIVVTAMVDDIYTVDVNGTAVLVNVTNGVGNASIMLGAGSYYANATVNENYSSTITNDTFEVFKASNSGTVHCSDNYYGTYSEIIVIADVDGVYTVDVNGTIVSVNVTGGTGFSRIFLGAGKYYANATFDNNNYTSKLTNDTFEVFKASNNAMVSVDDVVYGNESVIVVTATVDGIYTVDVNGTAVLVNVTGGTGNVSMIFGAGSYYANVTFNDNYTTDATNDTFEVFKASINIVVSVDDVVYGNESVIIVNATADGIYTVDVNGTVVSVTVANGTGNATRIFGVGSYYANVTFVDDNYTSTITNDTFEVFKASNNVVVTVDDVVYGNMTVIIVHATADDIYAVDVNGTIVSVTVVNGTGNATRIFGVGSYYANVTVNDNYTSTITNDTFEVFKAPNNVVVTVADVVYGNESVIVVTADGDGVYSVDVNGTIVSVTVVNGTGNYSMILGAGSYYANATFVNDNYTTTITNATFVVDKASNNVTVTVADVLNGEEVVINVTAQADGVYSVDVNGTIVSVTVVNGIGNASLSLPIGSYYANATFNNSNYTSNITNATFSVLRIIIEAENAKYGVGSTMVYEAKLVDERGNPISNRTLTFVVDGKTLNATTNAEGVANITLSLAVGTYDVSISANFTDNVTKEITVLPRIVENKDMVIDYDSTSFTVQAIGDDGNPIANEVVTMTVNGKTYKVKTDKNGKAKLPIELRPKTYTITSTYKGTTVKNTIKVKFTLKAKKLFKVKKTAKKLVLKATLKWSNGKAIIGKKITFRFKGKTYTVKTNKKGIAKVTIKKNVIKKLKKGKKYKVKVVYKNETVFSKVKVRR